MELTVTEALAEVKTTEKRIVKKREFIQRYMGRQEALKDPLAERYGSSQQALEQALQSVKDLEERIVTLRCAINAANASTILSVEGRDMLISEWLIWRREIAPKRVAFLNQISANIKALRDQAQQRGYGVAGPADSPKDLNDVIINLSEQDLANEMEQMETIMGRLDGKLSLLNATTFINIDE